MSTQFEYKILESVDVFYEPGGWIVSPCYKIYKRLHEDNKFKTISETKDNYYAGQYYTEKEAVEVALLFLEGNNEHIRNL